MGWVWGQSCRTKPSTCRIWCYFLVDNVRIELNLRHPTCVLELLSVVWEDFPSPIFKLSLRTLKGAPSSLEEFWIMYLEKGFSFHCMFGNLPPAFKGPSIHDVSSFVPTLQHQPLARSIAGVGNCLGFSMVPTWHADSPTSAAKWVLEKSAG